MIGVCAGMGALVLITIVAAVTYFYRLGTCKYLSCCKSCNTRYVNDGGNLVRGEGKNDLLFMGEGQGMNRAPGFFKIGLQAPPCFQAGAHGLLSRFQASANFHYHFMAPRTPAFRSCTILPITSGRWI